MAMESERLNGTKCLMAMESVTHNGTKVSSSVESSEHQHGDESVFSNIPLVPETPVYAVNLFILLFHCSVKLFQKVFMFLSLKYY